ncbi:MAG: hypothetical protein EAZ65_06535 [Verrucomicrobia bacterium]|nr:MAG: hypothetical protein EAZ84_06580 [Verrucomicrobiota bacterium]TAE88209.1 MAG: hypothetical protein EAZ82_05420 [Verrucomicrobiota bacterium]TAF26094.1 MAG: hypothetical protein EAZ71_06070 [Verrucomicrobiota bacterium]TAF40981.1 MAG: hypothetical protein EAZ65_06535 [Verrucomicrobiota bacterium]
MKLADLLPTLGFLIIFPLWFRMLGAWMYRKSAWQELAEHFQAQRTRGTFERLLRLCLGDTTADHSILVRREGDFIRLQTGLPFRLFLPHPPLKIPISRIRMKGKNRGTIALPGRGIPFEGFDPRDLS